MTRTVRLVAWSVILALAIFQAFAQRFSVGPDGISYLDLSDAVVLGHWSLLLNPYWSPLYPVLIGVARVIAHASAASEVPVVHIVDLVAFVGMSAAFEYMLVSILSLASRTAHSALAGAWGLAGVYTLFACFALTMIPLELTTPDLLCATAVFVTFGAMLRIHAASSEASVSWAGSRRRSRDAIVLGAALGLGALAKSFMVPWAVVCFVTLAIATRRVGFGRIAAAVIVWALFVVPWTALLSHAAGRFTAGDTGRLTYAWYVNADNPPSLGNVPMGARTQRIERILPGAGVTGPAPGTDPMWFDPARWNPDVSPHWNAADQLQTLRVFVVFYIQNLTPLLFLAVLIAMAPHGTRKRAWSAGWVVHVPALAGVAAYAMVLVTARYIMPFVLASALVLLATLPLARRTHPGWTVAGLAVPIAIEAASSRTTLGLALAASIVGGMLVGVLVSTKYKSLWTLAVVVGLGLTRAVLTPASVTALRLGCAGMIIVIYLAARASIRQGRPIRFAQRLQGSMALGLALVLVLRLYLRIDQDAQEVTVAASPAWGNVSANIAKDLAARGIKPGTHIAVIGPHAESYWARTARLNIVASVPRTLTSEFWQLKPAARDSLLAEFARSGAAVAIATVGPEDGVPDTTWTPVPYRGWIRRLAP